MPGHALRSRIYFGNVMHKRLRPFQHRFDYRVYAFLFDLDELARLDRELPLFSHNRANVFSLRDRDHGPRDGSPLKPWAERLCAEAGLELGGGRIQLLCLPRLFGYAFNPLSLWFCHGADGELRAVIYEVRNTFGDQHSYVIPLAAPPAGEEAFDQACEKGFYVSPFIPMAASYRFRLRPPGRRLAVLIRQAVKEGEILLATWTGHGARLGLGTLSRALLLYPLLTFKIMFAIHWQALWLWAKGARYYRRPQPPKEPVSLEMPAPQLPAE